MSSLVAKCIEKALDQKGKVYEMEEEMSVVAEV
jgi:hypothetical protein